MINKYKNLFLAVGTYIATLIGAGFASGQETVRFFVRYGSKSIFAVMGTSVIFGIVCTAVLETSRKHRINDFGGYLRVIMPEYLAKPAEWIITFFMMVVFSVMLAGGGETVNQITGMKEMTAAGIMCIFCMICFMFDIKALLAVNGAAAPLMIIGLGVVCIHILLFRETGVFANYASLRNNFAVSGFEYAGYNLLTAVVILVSMSDKIHDKKEARAAGILSGTIFFVMTALIWTVIKIYYGKINLGELPMLTLLKRSGNAYCNIYTAAFIMAVISTALSNGFGLTETLSEKAGLKKCVSAFIVCTGGYFGASVGFGELIEKGYGLCGYAGIVLLIFIIKDFIKKR